MDGPHFSPDGGECWEKDGILYWHDGDVTDLRDPGIAVRMLPWDHKNDYSAWTDEKRAEVREKWRLKRIAYTDQKDAEEADMRALMVSARQKLTEAEIDAIYYWFTYDCRRPWP